IATATVAVKEGRVQQTEAGLRTARSKTDSAQISLEKARHMVSMTRIASPIAGVVTRRNAHPGELVRTAESGGQEPILTIQRIDVVRVVVNIPDAEATETEVGAAVELQFDRPDNNHLKGYKVSRIGFAIDPKTATMRAEVDIP